MKLRFALSTLAAAALVAGVPALAAAQPAGGVVASTPVPNPPEKAPARTHKGAHHHKQKASHHKHTASAAGAHPTKVASAKPAPAKK